MSFCLFLLLDFKFEILRAITEETKFLFEDNYIISTREFLRA